MMDIPTLRAFFMWCTIVNGSVLVLTVFICAVAGDLIYSIQGVFYSISRETFDTVIYCWAGFYKIIFLTFNLAPFLALVIIMKIRSTA